MRVLFIGNSHTFFNDMPYTFARMCGELTGETPEVTMLAYPGRSLEWHNRERIADRFALLYGHYDYCVIQQQAHPFPGEETTFAEARKIAALCREVGTVPVIFMTWAQRGQPEVAAQMSRTYRALAAETDGLLAPLGEMFETAAEKFPQIGLYASDDAHASPAGDYMIAAAFASLLCGVRDLSALSDEAVDFSLASENDGDPREKIRIKLDAGTAKILRSIAEDALR